MVNYWKRVRYAAGASIFQEGDSGQDAYLIEHGKVAISVTRNGERKTIAVLGEAEMFGEIALIDHLTRTASATVLEDATLIPITRDLILSKLKESDALLSHLLQVVVERYRDAMDREGTSNGNMHSHTQHQLNLRDYAVGQLRVAQDLSEALEKGELLLYYQPVVHLSNGNLAGFEALIRWRHPIDGFVSPLGFIGVAEETGLIVPIGRWVIKTAIEGLRTFQAWLDETAPDYPPLFMSINVSARQLAEPGEVGEIIEIVRNSGVDPHRIKLEITESALIDNPELAALSLQQLKETGLLLAIDDFGTGYSSLSYLGRFPLDTLKIDQSFVNTMRAQDASFRITRAIAGMARDLEMNCIAEGIEHESDIATLRGMGCEYGQGYWYSKPRSDEQVMAYLAAAFGTPPNRP
jgi:EAL domain-containing protein (putative c-di-GMP-specific phosphodiesterase class I)